MKINILLLLTLFYSIVSIISFPSNAQEKVNKNDLSLYPDEIVFYSNATSFSPVIILQGTATVTWTWADNTTSNSTTPIKNYGTTQLTKNSLKVTPWSALRRINIGYDAQDGGSQDIELVADQKVSSVENLHLVAPFLKEWCSSYNNMDSLDFSNFVNLETIECFKSKSLINVNLANTPKLKRACFEENNLMNINVSGAPSLEDFRAALNSYNSITFSNSTQNIWHLCVRDNPQITSTNLFNNLSQFPNIAELFIWNTNQHGNLVIPSTNLNKVVHIQANNNQYLSVDLRGALKSTEFYGRVEISHNSLKNVNIDGCIQIKELDLSYNKLETATIDQILKQVDNFGTSNGTIDLRQNKAPTATGLSYKASLEKRGWNVYTDESITENIQDKIDSYSFKIYPNLYNDKIKIEMDKIPDEGFFLEISDLSGKKLLEQKILDNIIELSLKSPRIYFFTLRSKDWVKTRKYISYK